MRGQGTAYFGLHTEVSPGMPVTGDSGIFFLTLAVLSALESLSGACSQARTPRKETK